MAQLSEKAIKEFQELVQQKRGIILSYEDAGWLALEWLEMFRLVFKPIKENENEKKRQEKITHTNNT